MKSLGIQGVNEVLGVIMTRSKDGKCNDDQLAKVLVALAAAVNLTLKKTPLKHDTLLHSFTANGPIKRGCRSSRNPRAFRLESYLRPQPQASQRQASEATLLVSMDTDVTVECS